MDNLLTIGFEAHDDERNHHRRYEIVIGRDLLDDWTVSIRYGRTGQGGQEQRFGCPTVEEARAIIRERLRRRLSIGKTGIAPHTGPAPKERPALPRNYLQPVRGAARGRPLWITTEGSAEPSHRLEV